MDPNVAGKDATEAFFGECFFEFESRGASGRAGFGFWRGTSRRQEVVVDLMSWW